MNSKIKIGSVIGNASDKEILKNVKTIKKFVFKQLII